MTTHAKRINFTITRSKTDNDMLELVTHTKLANGTGTISTLWAVVHEDFLYDDKYLWNLLEQEGSIEVTLTLT